MRRRRRLPPDTRPKWNDPDLRDGKGHSGEFKQRAAMLNLQANVPTWRRDPTYNLRTRKIPSSTPIPSH